MVISMKPIFEIGWYVWHSHVGDIPVFVVGYLGKGSNGRHYMSISGSSTGIPFDELEKK